VPRFLGSEYYSKGGKKKQGTFLTKGVEKREDKANEGGTHLNAPVGERKRLKGDLSEKLQRGERE